MEFFWSISVLPHPTPPPALSPQSWTTTTKTPSLAGGHTVLLPLLGWFPSPCLQPIFLFPHLSQIPPPPPQAPPSLHRGLPYSSHLHTPCPPFSLHPLCLLDLYPFPLLCGYFYAFWWRDPFAQPPVLSSPPLTARLRSQPLFFPCRRLLLPPGAGDKDLEGGCCPFPDLWMFLSLIQICITGRPRPLAPFSDKPPNCHLGTCPQHPIPYLGWLPATPDSVYFRGKGTYWGRGKEGFLVSSHWYGCWKATVFWGSFSIQMPWLEVQYTCRFPGIGHFSLVSYDLNSGYSSKNPTYLF